MRLKSYDHSPINERMSILLKADEKSAFFVDKTRPWPDVLFSYLCYNVEELMGGVASEADQGAVR